MFKQKVICRIIPFLFRTSYIMDNAKFHKSKIVKDNIENSKNNIIYILPYNAKLNPIENLFVKLKIMLKILVLLLMKN